MKNFGYSSMMLAACLCASPVVHAQSAVGATSAQRPADFIVAVVNSEPITNQQVRLEIQRVTRQLTQAQQPIPEARLLAEQVLERLINDRAQLQFGRELGIKIDEAAIDQAEQSVARQNQATMEELLRRVAADGMDRAVFRNMLRDQLLMTRVREREIAQKVRVSELEVDQYLRDRQKATNLSEIELELAHVLIALPDEPTVAQLAAAQGKAQQVLERARAQEDFAKLARDESTASNALSGGLLGLRTADRYPTLFSDAVRDLPVGGLTLVRSGAGFHVLKVIEKRVAGLPATTIQQTRVSHILLRTSAQLSETTARERLAQWRKSLQSGAADFAALAREHSHDASAAQGGDLGWASTGVFVPEFEDAMNSLEPGQVSEPLGTRFGQHLILVTERRVVPLAQREVREAVRGTLREKKLDEAFLIWAQELRARAYVEMRQPPG